MNTKEEGSIVKSLWQSESLWGDDLNKLECAKRALYFYENGFIHLSEVIPHNLCDMAIREYDAWCNAHAEKMIGIRKDNRNPRVVNLHSQIDQLKDLFTHNIELLNLLDALFGYKTCVYTSLMFQYGTEQPFHRDTPVFVTSPERFYFGLWFALEDADHNNGCLEVIPGSHKVEEDNRYDFAEERFPNIDEIDKNCSNLWMPWQNKQLQKCLDTGLKLIKVTARKGDCVIWHPQMFHAGSKIVDGNKTRNSLVFHVTPEYVPVYQGDIFFNRQKANPPSQWNRSYTEYKNRLFLNNGYPSFGSN